MPLTLPDSCDVLIAGAGAAGLATAVFAGRLAPGLRIFLLDGAAKPGAKILVSGGSRCNVTNASVRETDFWGGRRTIIRRVLRAWPVDETVAFFADLGVTLHEEADGKLFPDSNRSRAVLDALLRGCTAAGATLVGGVRVLSVARHECGFRVETAGGLITARCVVLATGGASLPKSGSDGAGYAIAESLGHTIVPTTPALAPLVLDATERHAIHRRLSGVSHDVEITIRSSGAAPERLRGSLLWTHFGVSGPVVLNASRHWARAQIEGRDPIVTASLFPGQRFETLEPAWLGALRARPRAFTRSLLATLPEAVATAVLDVLAIDERLPLAGLSRDDRRRLAHAVLTWPLPVVDTRGYAYAEATAGGVDLSEIDPATMESRVCQGLLLVGEILDVDGRVGGFNFQWAWSTARVAARTASRLLPLH